MKIIIAFLLLLYSSKSIGQSDTKDTRYYSGGILLREVHDKKFKTISSKPVGKDVSVIVDTLFKMYTIIFLDEDSHRKTITLKFIDYYFDEPHDTDGNVYLMECQKQKFMVCDFMDHPLINVLSMTYEQSLPDGNSMLFVVRNIKRL